MDTDFCHKKAQKGQNKKIEQEGTEETEMIPDRGGRNKESNGVGTKNQVIKFKPVDPGKSDSLPEVSAQM
jgi:hypothetical protein